MNLHVLGAEVALSCKEHLNVLRRRIEDRRELSGRHLDDSIVDEIKPCGV